MDSSGMRAYGVWMPHMSVQNKAVSQLLVYDWLLLMNTVLQQLKGLGILGCEATAIAEQML